MWLFSKKQASNTNEAPFPWRQMLVLGLCRLCEPIAFMSIFPYVYFMVESFHITTNEREITFYAGTVTAAFAFAEFLAALIWGIVSDRIGRKPVLMCGIAGTGISMIMFGLSTSLPMAIIARALGGLLNGNIGVINATVTDLVKDGKHRARGFTMMPFVWCIGTIIGAAIGGALADPVKNHGWSTDSIFATYPFLLPNLVCTAVVIFGLVFGILFLEEAHKEHKHRKDYGLEAGRWFLRLFDSKCKPVCSKQREVEEEHLLVEPFDDDLPSYVSAAASPRLSASTPDGIPPPAYQSKEGTPRSSVEQTAVHPLVVPTAAQHDIESGRKTKRIAWRELFNAQVLLQVCSMGILAYHTITAEQLLPVMFSQPETEAPMYMPFLFTGGFGWDLKTVGSVLATQGVIQIVVNIAVYPWVNSRISTLTLMRIINWTYPLLYITIPYLILLPHWLRVPCTYALLIWKVTWQAFAFPTLNVVLASHVKGDMGTVQGVASSAASLARAIGPLVAGAVQTIGLTHGAIGLPWWVTALVTCIGGVISIFVVYEPPKDNISEKSSDSNTGPLATPERHSLLEPSAT